MHPARQSLSPHPPLVVRDRVGSAPVLTLWLIRECGPCGGAGLAIVGKESLAFLLKRGRRSSRLRCRLAGLFIASRRRAPSYRPCECHWCWFSQAPCDSRLWEERRPRAQRSAAGAWVSTFVSRSRRGLSWLFSRTGPRPSGENSIPRYFQESSLESARSVWPLIWKIRLASTTIFLRPPLPTIETVWHLLVFKGRPQVPRKVLVQSTKCCRTIGESASRIRSSAKAMARIHKYFCVDTLLIAANKWFKE